MTISADWVSPCSERPYADFVFSSTADGFLGELLEEAEVVAVEEPGVVYDALEHGDTRRSRLGAAT